MIPLNQKRFYDIAGQHQIDDQVIEVLLAGGLDDADFFNQGSYQDQKEHGYL